MLGLFIAGALASQLSDTFSVADDTSFLPSSGWSGGYSTDSWQILGGRVGASHDDGGGTWGTGGPLDNWIVRNDVRFRSFAFDTVLSTGDDDAIGLVYRWVDARHYYLVFFTSADMGPAAGVGGNVVGRGGWVYRVDDGLATVLASTPVGITVNAVQAIRLIADGPSVEVWFDADASGVIDPDERVMTATDSAFREGGVGFYCYENADVGCWFDDLDVSGTDANVDADNDGISEADDCDDADPSRSSILYAWPDADADGFGDGAGAAVSGCTPPIGYAGNDADCDDADGGVNPGAIEVCDGVDDDCNGMVDDDPADGIGYYVDADGDGFGDPRVAESGCAVPDGYAPGDVGLDCDDSDPDVHPGADEIWYDGIDQNCDGEHDWDRDGDGAIGADAGGPDCDDLDPTVSPDGVDVPDDGIDQNCNGADAITYAGRPTCRCATGGVGSAGWISLIALSTLARRRGPERRR